ncbi:ribonuclease D [Ketogulonicigenium vulgare]|uniref:Ribonuclease D n=1 Tax=Ketogulonicigenium vulgare (strain WSH-001) TaxID=759362 RepID=F9Y4Z0_KETVW|nr:ribonuclease D [Ketogulonicigenium vulgare]ADO42424.1 ribonuclease D [Ketogulonicigenium vulgare Y25]AEM40622.1 Ribonuclease D [Ketogulonicigenium vulgare WSH-001]ALJ80797.1 ribonuclease D [Ketogulonicigenium vulgare]ANW33579.1 ribonuclease D [Ketogulonicigenium vulgare]AOZ54336.1 ribonuclease D [Ketogulonicigenium vulgare]
MKTITTTEALASFCAEAAKHPYVTVDTEFLRERTYYAKLCLVQLAFSGPDADAALVDPLADGIDLKPLYDLFLNPAVVKVFHAARQDLEIFSVGQNVIPAPLFDTQVAAMVCGYGEQVSYETLARKIAKADIDKTSRFTDWSRRPLSEAQKEYALADVTHLRQIYENLSAQIAKSGRAAWVAEEMGVLNDPDTYRVDPEQAWLRVKTRTSSAKFLAVMKELARFREEYAQAQDVPRSRVYKDDAMLELASLKPATEDDLGTARLLLREARRGPIADGILAAVKRALALRPDQMPRLAVEKDSALQVNPALADLLRVLLKARSEAEGVAQKLIASSHDLDAIAAGQRDVAALSGWRQELFGDDALALCEGKIALAAKGQNVVTIRLSEA